ncbi:RNA polymerase sigma-70 factor (ECF subfamily) [Paenibacillus castaneae]|uniref:sigma-70 family RNA polymerase sigma factor n=1 Tax=Paenibacillus castaneae TaxID=474957 RepID=UPI000C9CD407|nr:sigma-70 family RNA polymerase sigma factor [Paenibacillus castaneae]NIK77729.1 RNA polymerase sigma-70 factor (ECF subfamily) [Paenibacillus castaneae]
MTRQPIDAAFEALTLPLEPELRRYCRNLAGSEWDGDDLFQETIIKAFRRFRRWPEREMSKPYMYRIAANAWFDICRRRKIAFLPEFLTDQVDLSYADWSKYDIRESLEVLMDALEPRQAALIVLTDVFGFSPTDTASALGQPITAIKAALHRARKRLKKAADRHIHLLTDVDHVVEASSKSKADAELLEAFVQAFRSADAKSMFRTYRDLSDIGVKIDRVHFMHGRAWFYFKDPDGNVLTVSSPLIKQSEA